MWASSSAATASPFIAPVRSSLTSSNTLGSLKCVAAFTMARARFSASSGGAKVVESFMKMPDPTKTASAPSCITKDASAGVAIPPAEKLGTGSFPSFATNFTSSYGAWCSLALAKMADAAFRHDGNRNCRHNFANLLRRGHAGDAAFGANLRGHAFEGHDGDCASSFGDGGLLGVGDVHDDAAFEHLGQSSFQAKVGWASVVLHEIFSPPLFVLERHQEFALLVA